MKYNELLKKSPEDLAKLEQENSIELMKYHAQAATGAAGKESGKIRQLKREIARIKTATHRLARTQHNWFRRDDSRIHWIDVSEGEPLEEALRVVESKLLIRRS